MNRVIVKWLIVFLSGVFATNLLASQHDFRVCETDLLSQDSIFHWQTLSAEVPMYLYPNETKQVYQKIRNSYLSVLRPEDAQRSEVLTMTSLLEELVSGQITPLVKIGPNPITDEVEIDFGSNLIIPVNCGDIDQSYLIDIIHLSNSLEKIHNASFSELRTVANQKIQRRNLQYQNWFDNGLAMWPQETWLNGLFLGESDAEEPAGYQLIFLRPSIGLGMNADDGLDDGKVEQVLGLEIGGFAHYLEHDYSSYWGLSLVATLGEDAGVGYGPLVRYNNFVLGFTRRDKDSSSGITEDRDYWYIGYDLLDLIADKKERFSGFKQKVRDNFSKFKSQ